MNSAGKIRSFNFKAMPRLGNLTETLESILKIIKLSVPNDSLSISAKTATERYILKQLNGQKRTLESTMQNAIDTLSSFGLIKENHDTETTQPSSRQDTVYSLTPLGLETYNELNVATESVQQPALPSRLSTSSIKPFVS
jgi:hypothetical protein